MFFGNRLTLLLKLVAVSFDTDGLHLPTFTAPEWVVVGVVALASVAAVVMMATGNLAVL